ncbi:MAG: hypothetical protein AUJ88_00335 [Gallionellaceae bacterium CG1_02_56_997]|nr:MAG: hypothetical protein AUJ88_00335 [Gallionellaceae bacterium CG1_02_56_997]
MISQVVVDYDIVLRADHHPCCFWIQVMRVGGASRDNQQALGAQFVGRQRQYEFSVGNNGLRPPVCRSAVP